MATSASSRCPELRLRVLRGEAPRPSGSFVLYWMTSARRTRWNYALDRAIELARVLDRPLVVVEALRVDYRWASDRLHRFVLQGMRDNAIAFERSGIQYYPYVEPSFGAGKGLLQALADEACAVVTDEFPCFFLPRMLEASVERVRVRFEAVDSNGLLPLRATERVFTRAFDFRGFLQRALVPHLLAPPEEDPLRELSLRPLQALPGFLLKRWPAASRALLEGRTANLAALPIDHGVLAVDEQGGAVAARVLAHRFVQDRLSRYDEERNHPDAEATSGLSPYLHFGHLAAHDVFDLVAKQEDWSPERIQKVRAGSRSGWWGMSGTAEALLDQLVTWRELGYNMASKRDDYDSYDSLPDWALATLAAHADDVRPYVYELQDFDAAATHDAVWNAAQTELRESGRMHNYLRMLWGKKILHWSRSPQAALEIMIELNNRYALDGRNPNSYSGIFWVLGRYDRAWGPEREVFGKIRYMSSKNTRRKLHLDRYLERWRSVSRV